MWVALYEYMNNSIKCYNLKQSYNGTYEVVCRIIVTMPKWVLLWTMWLHSVVSRATPNQPQHRLLSVSHTRKCLVTLDRFRCMCWIHQQKCGKYLMYIASSWKSDFQYLLIVRDIRSSIDIWLRKSAMVSKDRDRHQHVWVHVWINRYRVYLFIQSY